MYCVWVLVMKGSRVILFVLLFVVSLSILNISAATNNAIQIYIVHKYDNIVILTLNKLLFKYIGEKFYLLRAPDLDENTLFEKAVREIDNVVGNVELVSIVNVVLNGNYECIKTFRFPKVESIEALKLAHLINEITKIKLLKELGIKQLLIRMYRNNVLELDVGVPNGINEANINELVMRMKDVMKDYKVIIVETLGYGLPTYYECKYANDELAKIPCVRSLGEAAFGIFIDVDSTCVEQLAKAKGISFNDALNLIVNSIKRLSPLIRKCIPWQGITIVVAKIPKATPLPLTVPKKSLKKEITIPNVNASNHVTTSIKERENNYNEVSSNHIDNFASLYILVALVVASVATSVAIALRKGR